MPQAISNAGAEAMPRPQIRAEELPVNGVEVFRDSDRAREYLGIEEQLAMNDVLQRTGNEKVELLDRIKTRSPEVNGNVEKALEQIKLNVEQLQKKESFLKKTLMFPIRHPFITAAAAIGGYALLSSQLPGIFAAFGALEEKYAGTAIAKAIEYLRSFLPLSVGTTGSAPPSLDIPLPRDI